MDCIESSDLEEGEILENDNESLSNLSESWSDEFGNVNKHCNRESGNKENKANLLSPQSNDYQMPPRKHKLSDRSGNKSSTNMLDLGLEEVSSDGDCLSDNEKISNDLDYKIRKKKRSQFSGTVEDIMSEIGETISRKKIHCSHRKRKARHSFDKYKDNYNLWRHKTSHAKVKKPRRRLSSCDSSLEEISHGRKRKKRAYIVEESNKKTNIRDFDEVRQTLLEKLKKQKAEEAKPIIENLVPGVEEVENSEIQEVEMGIESTNYVDNPTVINPNLNNLGDESNKGKEEDDDDDDLDLIELRLAALESNSKQKSNLTNQKKVKSEEQTDAQSEKSEDMDLDRYELLLRAEALKTALLKKHQKRLNKAKEMENEVNSSSSNQFVSSFLPVKKGSSNDEKPGTSNVDVSEEKAQKRVENEKDESCGKNSSDDVIVITPPSSSSSTGIKKAKPKRKKRKSDSQQSNAKENTENADAFEEDDKTLRSQLLIDLLKKKSLKDSEKKPVLMDSVQTSVNQLPVASTEQTESKPKVQLIKKNSLQKVNTNSYVNTTKPATVPRIPKPEIQRIIVHLGSEDSSDENDAEEKSTVINRENKEENVTTKESSESILANNEKRVELLLSQTWQKIEKEMAAARNTHGTPEAVYKHLPLSQRLEYIRLKQKIAERERLKKMKEQSGKPPSSSSGQESSRKETSSQQSLSVNEPKVSKLEKSKPVVNLHRTGVVDKNVPLNSKNVRNLNSKQKIVAIDKINTVKNGRQYVAPPNGINVKQTIQKNSLLRSSPALISKLKLLLKKIKIEKTIEENYDKEISKLKNQINLFEKRKLEQKFKIKKLAEESSRTYKVIQQITNLGKKPMEEKVEKSNDRVQSKSGEAVKATEESKCEIVKVDETKNIMNVAEASKNEEMAREEKGSKSEEIVKGPEETKANNKEMNESDNVSLPSGILLDYNSPLQAFNKTSDNTNRVDPNVMMCQFDLLGVCKDKECTYQHFRNSQILHCTPIQVKPIEEE